MRALAATLMLAVIALPGIAAAEAPASPATDPLSEQDRELLEFLDLLEDLDLLEEWDPQEDLPIPVDATAGPEEEAR